MRRRALLLVVGFALAAAYVVLQGQAAVLESMAPPACTPGSPAHLQGGPGAAGEGRVIEIVTGWHAFGRASAGAQVEAGSTACTTTLAITNPNVAGYSGRGPARAWLLTDLVAFAPLYAVLAWLVIAWARRQRLRHTLPGGRDDPAYPVLRASRWASRQWWMAGLVGVALVCDWTENVLLLRRLDAWWRVLDTRGVLRADDLGLTVVHVIGWVKWTALAVVLIGVVLVFGLRQLARAARALRRALPALWLQVLIVVLFSLAVAVPDQSADAIRRLSLGQWVFTLSVTAVLSFVLLATALGAIRPTAPRPARDPSDLVWSGLPVLGLGIVVIAMSRLTSFRGLLVPGVIVTAVGLVSLVLDVLARRESGARVLLERADNDASTDGEPPVPEPPERAVDRRHVAVALALTPVAALGIAAVRSSAGDVALLGAGPSGRIAARLVIGCLLVIGAAALVLPVNQLGKWLVTVSDGPRLAVLGLLLALHAPGLLMHDPDVNIGHAHQVGALALVMAFLSGFALLPTAAAWLAYLLMSFRYSRPFAVPSAVRILRFDTTPVLGLIVLWALLAGLVSYRDYHDIRRVAVADSENPSDPAPKSLDDVVAGWFARQAGRGAEPALLVAASGGGIRAAYWTAAVLDCIIERDGPSIDPCSRPADPDVVAARRRSLMVMSGISGGSLGLAAYVTAVGEQWSSAGDADALAPEWYDERLGDDYLAPDVAAWLFNDGLNALLRPNHGVDRAAVMERAWEASWDGGELGLPFLRGQASGDEPLLLLSGYNVEDGCRVNTSVLASAHGAPVSTCRSVPNGQLSLLRATADLTAQLCPGDDIRMSTAALNSARFPFVSPSGRVPGCTRTAPPGPGAPPDLEVVDGGYRETSGASPIVELWPGLSTLLDDAADDRCAAPVFLQIDNGYASDAVSSSGARVVAQEIVPVVAFSNSSGGIESAARQGSLDMLDEHYGNDTRGSEWFRITTFAHPGSSAPLGWVLSDDARDDLHRQLVLNGDVIAAVRTRLAYPADCQAT